MTVPKDQPGLLPGLTAFDRRQRPQIAALVWIGFAGVAWLLILAALIIVGHVDIPEWLPEGSALALALVILLVYLCYVLPWSLARDRERRAGYTTQCGYRTDVVLWQLDPETGEVLSRPDEPGVTGEQWQARKRARDPDWRYSRKDAKQRAAERTAIVRETAGAPVVPDLDRALPESGPWWDPLFGWITYVDQVWYQWDGQNWQVLRDSPEAHP